MDAGPDVGSQQEFLYTARTHLKRQRVSGDAHDLTSKILVYDLVTLVQFRLKAVQFGLSRYYSADSNASRVLHAVPVYRLGGTRAGCF